MLVGDEQLKIWGFCYFVINIQTFGDLLEAYLAKLLGQAIGLEIS